MTIVMNIQNTKSENPFPRDAKPSDPAIKYLKSAESHWTLVKSALDSMVYQLLGESGTYYGVRFGKKIAWVTEFPFGYIRDPQYVGSILSLVALLCWIPSQYVLLWILGYFFMMCIESKEEPSTRAKPRS
ncbi:hypothetical protein AMTR_s00065p00211190 [Amborella trichopoda]|uniref:phosphatidyl-N-methylethanolamine N-methyltransferase n=1 Tax=Amborella trichopoda TaxID=13333 RepID=U5CZC6_AMBTC|nr:hypothetical protein AMTR_s00065p00211190 [Amborella trichopoda]